MAARPFQNMPPAADRPCALSPGRGRRDGFALVVTLLILSLLVIVAVSYLTSMTAERQTADAYDAKAAAEQAAQAGVDTATAMLSEAFRDFPDSATVWDTQQSSNGGSPANHAVVNASYNEGTTLYLRAAPSGSAPVVANPLPDGRPAPGATPLPANSTAGNDPCNPACQTFVLPLISGVPNGQARLVSDKASIFTKPMDVGTVDPAAQNWVDLNVRRFGVSTTYPNGDLQGAVGSPPGWSNVGPKPARAYWVPLTGSDGLLKGRYAFWVEDNSFRANVNLIGDTNHLSGSTPRVDNTSQPLDSSSKVRSLQPSDISMPGFLAAIDSGTADGTASALFTLRTSYPGGFLPDTRGFAHASLTSPGSETVATYDDQIAYLSTAQSGALNLSRHGTQRLNLNAVVPQYQARANPSAPDSANAITSEIQQLVSTMAFHLPSFGQRFYRTSNGTTSGVLNDATQVSPNAPLTIGQALSPASGGTDNSLIYLYKVATNIHDYIDSSTQPTVVAAGGQVLGQTQPNGPPDEGGNNPWWAQGKKPAPFIQEAAVRYRPIVANSSSPTATFNYERNHFDLAVDYYVEFWNMSDQDVYAVAQPSNPKLPHLNGAQLLIQSQQGWSVYPTGAGSLQSDPAHPTPSEPLMPPGADTTGTVDSLLIDLTNNAYGFDANFNQIPLDGSHNYTTADGRVLSAPKGAVFPAGSVTVITTDPSCFLAQGSYYPTDPNIAHNSGSLKYAYRPLAAPSTNSPTTSTGPNPLTTIYCKNLISGQRHYSGKIVQPGGAPVSSGGLQFSITNGANYVADISLVNQYGYLDFARNAIVESGTGAGANENTSTYLYDNQTTSYSSLMTNTSNYNDFGYSSSLVGNVKDSGLVAPPNAPAPLYSELGDPRTNNEQLSIMAVANLSTAGTADQSRYFASNGTLGYPNNMTVRPDGKGGAGLYTPVSGWPDYFTNGSATVSGTVPNTAYPNLTLANAPMVIAGTQLTSIGQLGDVYDPARLQGTGSTYNYSRGGGRTFKIGQHDDRYDATPNADGSVASSTGWASWRLADIFSTYPLTSAQSTELIELPGRININGVPRDKGAALRAVLNGFAFQPATTSDPLIHGDNHSPTTGASSLAGQTLNVDPSTSAGVTQVVTAINTRFAQASGSLPFGPFFERGELGELVGTDGQFLFGLPFTAAPPFAAAQTNTNFMNGQVDMNATFDRGREELFRRLSELICTRGDTFTVYAVGQSLVQTNANATPKVTGTQHMRVTFRLVPKLANGTDFHPAYDANGAPVTFNLATSSDQINLRFAKPDHYGLQILETSMY